MKLPEIMMVPLDKLKDNPWRDKKRNPINPEKVEQIKESIVSTGEFWLGVYGRKVAGGFVELAFGHHRADAAKAVDTGDVIEAAKSAGLKEIPVAVRDFTDGEMLMRMTRENLRGDLPVVLEAVSAAVRAYAEGKIEIPVPDPKTQISNIRYAPSFTPGKASSGSEPEHPYTAATVAKFLGGIYIAKNKGKEEPANSVRAALGILELEERHIAFHYEGMRLLKIIEAVSSVKKRIEEAQSKRGKTQDQLKKEREAALKAIDEAKVKEREAEIARKAADKAEARAKKDKEDAEAKAEAKRLSEERDRAEEEAKEASKVSVEQAAKVQRTEKQVAEDTAREEYAPTLALVQSAMSEIGRIADEGTALAGKVKALGNMKSLKLGDRQRLWDALQEAGARCDTLSSWVFKRITKGDTRGKH